MKILIDLNTLKKNKHSGQTTSYVQAWRTVYFTAKGLPPILIDDVNCDVLEEGFDEYPYVRGVIRIPELTFLQEIQKHYPDVEFEVDNLVIRIDHFPIPEYDYEYVPTEVVCIHCKSTFLHNKLVSDSFGDVYVTQICPVCGEGYCCKIEYESIEDALKRTS